MKSVYTSLNYSTCNLSDYDAKSLLDCLLCRQIDLNDYGDHFTVTSKISRKTVRVSSTDYETLALWSMRNMLATSCIYCGECNTNGEFCLKCFLLHDQRCNIMTKMSRVRSATKNNDFKKYGEHREMYTVEDMMSRFISSQLEVFLQAILDNHHIECALCTEPLYMQDFSFDRINNNFGHHLNNIQCTHAKCNVKRNARF